MGENKDKLLLVSFNHPVAIMLDGRAILVGCAVAMEFFQTETTLSPKVKPKKAKQLSSEQAMDGDSKMTLDFPMMLRIISLADGKPLKLPVDIMVKWNNISALCWL